jgi:hypothetical protein
MPKRWSVSITSLTICRYRGSNTCSGRRVCGKKTMFGRGNSGRRNSPVGSGGMNRKL